MHRIDLLILFMHEHRHLAYVVLFLGMIFEGEIILMTAGILVHIGALKLGPTFLVAFSGVMVNDALWYQLGVYLKYKHDDRKIIRWFKNKTARFLISTQEKPFKAMFISKFIAGLNHPTLVLLGFLKVDFRYYMKMQVFISFLWTLFFLALGFLFGFAAISYSHKLHKFIVVSIILVVGIIIIDKILKYFLRDALKKEKKA